MSLRKITVHLTGSQADDDALTSAVAVAKRFGSHIDALFVASDVRETLATAGDAGILSSVLERAIQEENEPRREKARQSYERACAAAELRQSPSPSATNGPSARWREVTGPPETVAIEGRLSDLVLFGHIGAEAGTRARAARQAALATAGRPILLTPPALEKGTGDVIAIGWNGSRHAARAVAGAMPFLQKAEKVRVVTIDSGRTATSAEHDTGALLIEYLALHDVRGTHIQAAAAGGSFAAVLLETSTEIGADLLVIGCSGHERLREFVLGNVSREVIAEARLPVLIAH